MSKTDHKRPPRRSFKHDTDPYGKRQPRPVLRKQGTRKGAVLAALREHR